MKKHVEIYSDGACSGNPGPGGWCSILVYNGKELELSGFEAESTNNRMELTAVVEALRALNVSCAVTVYSDSKYVVDSVNKGWLKNWSKNGWKNSQKQTVPNLELWKQLVPLLEKHEASFVWIKGHAGHTYNERCDAVAVKRYSERM